MSRENREMFAGIAHRYDLANTVLSFGIHRRWRTDSVRLSGASSGESVLDCATGTGDFAIAFKSAVGPSGRVVGVDFCPEMLAPAPTKSRQAGCAISYLGGDVLALPFPDRAFDLSSIAFGIRNVDDPIAGIREMARVVRPGGRVCVLEFGRPEGRLLGLLYRGYSRWLMPRLGGGITGSRSAFEYLPATASRFPTGIRFVADMQSTGCFSDLRVTPLSGGIAYCYIGVVRR